MAFKRYYRRKNKKDRRLEYKIWTTILAPFISLWILYAIRHLTLQLQSPMKELVLLITPSQASDSTQTIANIIRVIMFYLVSTLLIWHKNLFRRKKK